MRKVMIGLAAGCILGATTLAAASPPPITGATTTTTDATTTTTTDATTTTTDATTTTTLPPTTSATTTTTTTPPPAAPTRGVVQCVSQGNSPWSDWVRMGEHTQVSLNASIEFGSEGYPHAVYRFSVDGTNPLPEPNVNGFAMGAQFHRPSVINTAFPYIQFRCANQHKGTPVLVWMLRK
jgi:hypothetical protein